MKKIILTVLVAGSLLATSCKEAKKGASDLKDATVDAANKTVDATKDAATKTVDATKDAADAVVEGAKELVSSEVLEGVKLPEFTNPEVTKNLTEYANYAKEYIAANGDLGKISGLAAKGKELLAKGKELASKLDATELAKYKSALAAIQAKMAPAH